MNLHISLQCEIVLPVTLITDPQALCVLGYSAGPFWDQPQRTRRAL